MHQAAHLRIRTAHRGARISSERRLPVKKKHGDDADAEEREGEGIRFATGLVHRADVRHELHVQIREPVRRHPSVLKPGRGHAVPPDKLHHKDVVAQQQRRRRGEAGCNEAREVSHLLLGPRSDHLAWVALAVAVAEAPVAGDVAVSVLKNQD